MPHKGQRKFHDAFEARDERGDRLYKYFVLCNGRRWGKDRACALQFIKTFTELDNRPPDPSRVPHTHGWVVAPIYPMAQQMWRELKAFWPEHLIAKLDNNDFRIETKRGGVIEVRSAHRPDDLVSVGLDLLWVTEAARVQELAWTNIQPMLNSPGREGLALLNSTPKGMNWFGKAYWYGQDVGPDGLPKQRVPKWWSMTAPTSQNSYLSKEQLQSILDGRWTMPEDLYAQEYEARILNNGSTVFRGVDAAIGGILLSGPIRGHSYVMGVDLGKLRDFTVITVMDRESKQVVEWHRMNLMNWEVQIPKIVEMARKWRATRVEVDQTGIGEPIVDRLKRLIGRATVEGYKMASNQQKLDLIQPLQVAIERKEIKYPNIQVMLHELRQYEYQISEKGTWTMNAPEGEHDDAVVSLALALRACENVTIKLSQGYRRLYPSNRL